MNAKQTTIAIDAINALNLDAIKTKLMHRASGEGWSQAHADAVEIEYRRFLTLMKLYPNDANAPMDDVDTFWHYHILDTAKYAADCAAAFGYFLHHYPYLGMADADGPAELLAAGARTGELYAATFGAAMRAMTLSPCSTFCISFSGRNRSALASSAPTAAAARKARSWKSPTAPIPM